MINKEDRHAVLAREMIVLSLGHSREPTPLKRSEWLQRQFDYMRAKLDAECFDTADPEAHALDTLAMLARLLKEGVPDRLTLDMIADYFEAKANGGEAWTKRVSEAHLILNVPRNGRPGKHSLRALAAENYRFIKEVTGSEEEANRALYDTYFGKGSYEADQNKFKTVARLTTSASDRPEISVADDRMKSLKRQIAADVQRGAGKGKKAT